MRYLIKTVDSSWPQKAHAQTSKETAERDDQDKDCSTEKDTHITAHGRRDTFSQGAQRAEVRAAARWVAWAWGPTELWTDSSFVVKGIRNVLRGAQHGMKVHRDLWQRIHIGINAKGRENFAVEKVKGHMKETKCQGDEHRGKKKERQSRRTSSGSSQGSRGSNNHFQSGPAREKADKGHSENDGGHFGGSAGGTAKSARSSRSRRGGLRLGSFGRRS